MANRDIAGLLTGIPSGGLDPMAKLTPQQMRAQAVMGGIEQMGRGLRGLANQDRRTQSEVLQDKLKSLDLTSSEGLTKLAEIQKVSGDLTGAATTIGKAQQLKQIQARKESLLKVARAQGNELVEEYIITAGDTDAALNKIQEVLFRKDPSPKSSSAPTKGDIALYTKLLEQYTDKELEGLGLETSFSFFGQGGVDDADKLIIINSAKEIATNFPKLGKKGALAEALRQYGISKSAGSTSTETPTDTNVIESSSRMTGKKIR
jgi:hypothetical protein